MAKSFTVRCFEMVNTPRIGSYRSLKCTYMMKQSIHQMSIYEAFSTHVVVITLIFCWQGKFGYLEINHFSHKHPLRFRRDFSFIRDACSGVWDHNLMYDKYECDYKSCGFKRRLFCAELLWTFQNPYHPHPVILRVSTGGEDEHFVSISCGLELG